MRCFVKSAISFGAAAWVSAAMAQGLGTVDISLPHKGNTTGFVPKPIGNEIIYEVVVDRFANGNSKNDCAQGLEFCSPNHADWYKYWGGDLRGLIQHLDYIRDLGATRIWLTPIFENQPVLVPRVRNGSNVLISSYHGYWIRDWFRLNDAFTDKGVNDTEIVKELARSAGDMHLVFDTVTNHTNPVDPSSDSLSKLENREPLNGGNGRSHKGAFFRNGNYVVSIDEDAALAAQGHGYVPFFHHNPMIANWSDPYQVQNFMLDNLADLNQDNPAVRSYMHDAHNYWLDLVPNAGFRVDTIKHVPMSYWDEFAKGILQKQPSTELIGEYFDGGGNDADSVAFYKKKPFSMFDFSFRNTLRDVYLKDAPFSKIVDLWRKDENFGDARAPVTFLDNHDLPRMRGEGLSEWAVRQGMAFWILSRGVPCIYYGLEQDLFTAKDPGDPYNRPMMASFDETHWAFQELQALISLRKRNQALRYGSTHVVHLTEKIIAFERLAGAHGALFVASKNPGQDGDLFTIQGLKIADGVYHDVLTNQAYTVHGGQLDVNLRFGDSIVLSTD